MPPNAKYNNNLNKSTARWSTSSSGILAQANEKHMVDNVGSI